jgi:hypothetical protein
MKADNEIFLAQLGLYACCRCGTWAELPKSPWAKNTCDRCGEQRFPRESGAPLPDRLFGPPQPGGEFKLGEFKLHTLDEGDR